MTQLPTGTKSDITAFVRALPFAARAQDLPPRKSGLYFVYDSRAEHILYVGKAVDFRRRWKLHRLRNMVRDSANIGIYYLVGDASLQSETYFIRKLSPPLNIAGVDSLAEGAQ